MCGAKHKHCLSSGGPAELGPHPSPTEARRAKLQFEDAAQPASLHSRTAGSTGIHRRQTQEVSAMEADSHNRTGGAGFMRLDAEGWRVWRVSILGQSSRQFLGPSLRLPAAHTLLCVSATLLLSISSTADVAHSRLRRVMNCVVCAA